MQTRLIELHQQRGRLLERIAHQRQTLASQVAPLLRPLSLPGRVAAALRDTGSFVLQHPYLLGTAALSVLVLKPGFVLRWARRGVFAWRAWRSLRRLVPPGAVAALRQTISAWRAW